MTPEAFALHLQWRITVIGGIALGMILSGVALIEGTPGNEFFSTAAQLQVVFVGVLMLQRRIFFPSMNPHEEDWAFRAVVLLFLGLLSPILALTGVAGRSGAFVGTSIGLVGSVLGIFAGLVMQTFEPASDSACRWTAVGTAWYPSLRTFIAADPRRARLHHRWYAFAWEDTPLGRVLTHRLAWSPVTREVYAVQRIHGTADFAAWGPVEVLGKCPDRRTARTLLGRRGWPAWTSLDAVRQRLW
jgi:hypothetical protein